MPNIKTIWKPIWTIDLKGVQSIARTIQTQALEGLWFFPNSHSVLFNWNLFKTIIKTKISRKNVAFSVKYVLKITKFKYWGFVTAIWFQSLLFYFFLCNCWDVISFTKSKKLNNVLSLFFLKKNCNVYRSEHWKVLLNVCCVWTCIKSLRFLF